MRGKIENVYFFQIFFFNLVDYLKKMNLFLKLNSILRLQKFTGIYSKIRNIMTLTSKLHSLNRCQAELRALCDTKQESRRKKSNSKTWIDQNEHG